MTDLPPPPSPDPDPPPSNRRTPVLIGAVLAVIVVLAAGALILRKRQQDHYCEVYDRTHADLVEATRDTSRALSGSTSDLRAMEQALETSRTGITRINGLLTERRDAAPASLRESYDVIISDSETDNGSLSQRKARADAVEAIDSYARDVCDLAGDM